MGDGEKQLGNDKIVLAQYYVIIFFRQSSWTIDLILVLQVGNSDSECLNNLPHTKDLVNITIEPQIPTL